MSCWCFVAGILLLMISASGELTYCRPKCAFSPVLLIDLHLKQRIMNNTRSQAITRGVERTPNRAMLRAVGFQDADFEKPIVAVANGYSTITPCNLGLNA